MTRALLASASLAAASILSASCVAAQDRSPDEVFAGAMEYRSIGPFRGGRVTAVAGVSGVDHTYYMGAVGGGVWKTTNAGRSWDNVSDGFLRVGSVGALAVAPSDPNVVWCGTGSACPRGNVQPGDGVYRSTDAGRTWAHVGLDDAGQIARIHVHPDDPDRAWVAVLGDVFEPGETRGVYRTTDGGASWERVLYVSERTGAADLSMNPHNPRELYAAMWRAERKPWTMIDGAEEGGLFKTVDGGDTWTQLEEGLPTGVLGRTGVSVSAADPDRVFALFATPEEGSGLYRSDDAGESWEQVSADRELITRAWYYGHVFAHPTDANTVYVLNVGMWRSIDGGESFHGVRAPHSDHHDLWIDPEHPERLVQGNDGGAIVSLDGMETWSSLYNQPTAEFYRVAVDGRFPYQVYAAQQDNTCIAVPSIQPGGITAEGHWYPVGGGESGHVAVHPEHPDVTYSGNYIGILERHDRRTGQSRDVMVYPQMADGVPPKDLVYRFNWNAPVLISAHDHDVIFHASHVVHRSRDEGQSWETISPDLSHDDESKQELPGGPVQHDFSGVEVYGTVLSLSESPHAAGELWAGTDDGRVHLTRDDGASWTDVTPPGMPDYGTVNTIELSPHAPGRAYVAVFKYRMGDDAPYVFRTDDFGATWSARTAGIPDDHIVRVVREDPARAGLLYAGTEYGVFVSFDEGGAWQPLQLELPAVQVADLRVHRGDLVVATHGRSFWILDDMSHVQQWSDEVAAADVHLFTPRDAVRAGFGGYDGEATPENPEGGAWIHYRLAEGFEGALALDVLDADGELVRSFSSEAEDGDDAEAEGDLSTEPGLHRFVWDLMSEELDLVEDAVMSLGYDGGQWMPVGEYTARLTVTHADGSEAIHDAPLRIVPDPRHGLPAEDLAANHHLVTQIRDAIEVVHDEVRTIRSVREQAHDLAARAEAAGHGTDLADAADALDEVLTAIEEELIQTRNEASNDALNFPPKLDNQLVYLYGHVMFGVGRPSEGSYQRFVDLTAEIAPHVIALDRALAEDLAAFEEQVQALGLPAILVPEFDR